MGFSTQYMTWKRKWAIRRGLVERPCRLLCHEVMTNYERVTWGLADTSMKVRDLQRLNISTIIFEAQFTKC